MKTRTTTLSLFLAYAVMAAWTVAAQQPTGPRDQGDRPPRPPVDTALDANGDEVADAREIAAAAAALKTLDRNGDGRLSADECLPKRPAGGGPPPAPDGNRQGRPANGPSGADPKHPVPPVFTALDTSHDGVVDAGEIAAAPTALLTLDQNGDGRLSPDEYRPPRPGDAPQGKGDSR